MSMGVCVCVLRRECIGQQSIFLLILIICYCYLMLIIYMYFKLIEVKVWWLILAALLFSSECLMSDNLQSSQNEDSILKYFCTTLPLHSMAIYEVTWTFKGVFTVQVTDQQNFNKRNCHRWSTWVLRMFSQFEWQINKISTRNSHRLSYLDFQGHFYCSSYRLTKL